MKFDMCFPSTEEFLSRMWLCFSAMFPSWSKFRLGSDRPCDHGSVGISRSPFPAKVWDPRGDCPAYVPEPATRTRRLLQNVDDRSEERSRANLHESVEWRLVPGLCSVPAGFARLLALRLSHLSSGTASGLLRRPAAPRSSASTALRVSVSQNKSSAQNALPRAGDFFWVPPRKLTLALGAGPTRMAAPRVP